MEEIWQLCKRNEDYEVSNLGHIRNAQKKVLIRKPNIAGYIRAYLGSAGTVSLHILIAEAFIPKPHPSKKIVNHIDGIRHNNNVTNLEWVTHKENCNRKVFPCIKPNRPTKDDHEGEVWREFIYKNSEIKVSNLGRICTKSGIKTAGSMRKDEYMCISLIKDASSIMVHRIICTAFHGPPPTKKHVVNHIDENRQNNRPENLEWVTQKQNVLHSTPKRLGIPAHNKRKILQMSLEGDLIQTFDCVSEAATKTNTNRSGIQQFLKNTRGLRQCGGFVWKYAE